MRTPRCSLVLLLLAGCGPDKMLDPSTSLEPQTFPPGEEGNDDDPLPEETGQPTGGGTTGIASNTVPTNPSSEGMSESGVSGTSTSTSASASGTTTQGSGMDLPPPDTSDTRPPDTSAEGGTFIERLDLAVGECDVWAEDCPNGQKCMPIATRGSSWDSLKCVPVTGSDGPGDPCTYEDGVNGIDSCEKHAICLGPEPSDGTCVGMCEGAEDDPICPAGQTCAISNGGVLILCVDTCNPLTEPCDAGDVCVFLDDEFTCATDASGTDGQAGDACEFINVCDPGLACIDSSLDPECNQNIAGCCSPFCDVNEPAPCSGSLSCVPWFEEGQAPPGYENLGICAMA